ncbi:unnamed protein product [Owenia fusiformis]|uniref:Calpain-5 n=1 Tax=Owenia fusiformis TaxID=6347 RepID=A0A8J1TTX9_OWEFU|nr:unnamed protein product [Owenia fusiformis]CAH1789674.1 unnamed protein product [Owenia fusiformis]
MPSSYKNQKFSSLKKECLKKGELFVDSEFPPNNKSLFYSKVDNDIEWKRPKELCKVPKLVVKGVSCDDLSEGELGNCWFVSACSSLAQESKMWAKVIPDIKEQEYSNEAPYAGILHFQFWRFGDWIDVVIDDLLPTKDNKLIFCHSNSSNEFWSALLEKAYAKLYGDYESLVNGCTADTLVDFTGGVAESHDLTLFDLHDKDGLNNFFLDLRDGIENRSLITACISCEKDEIGQECEQGLKKGHSYGVTAIKKIEVMKNLKAQLGNELYLVRIRNPWGTEEWTGAWSDNSREWQMVNAQDRDKMGIVFDKEGEFWMSFDDFLKHFTGIDVCHFVNTAFFSLKRTWHEALLPGNWTRELSGGCSAENPQGFLFNPQFVFDINGPKDVIMISLEQDDAGKERKLGSSHDQIGFHVMKVETNRRYRVHVPGEKIHETEFVFKRCQFARFHLEKGRYVIIPSIFKAGIQGKFLLRLYTGSNALAKELVEDAPASKCCVKPHVMVTCVDIINAEGLAKNEKNTTDPYVVIKCEGETVKSEWNKETLDPVWNLKTIFYRKKPDIPITVEVMNHNTMLDDFMGIAEVPETGLDSEESKEYKLMGKGKKEKDVEKPGTLFLKIRSSNDLGEL